MIEVYITIEKLSEIFTAGYTATPYTTIMNWAKSHGGKYLIQFREDSDVIVFEDTKDALAFKLKYGL